MVAPPRRREGWRIPRSDWSGRSKSVRSRQRYSPVDSSDGWILHLRDSPAYDSLRSHPRYPALLRKMNLAP
jgi:hypothetical protein